MFIFVSLVIKLADKFEFSMQLASLVMLMSAFQQLFVFSLYTQYSLWLRSAELSFSYNLWLWLPQLL